MRQKTEFCIRLPRRFNIISSLINIFMPHENPIYRLLELPDNLQTAEAVADIGLKKQDSRYFESAFATLESSQTDVLKAEKKLDRSYNLNLSREDIEPIDNSAILYRVKLDKLDEHSSPATIGMALPWYLEMVKETREYILNKFEELNVEKTPGQYSNSSAPPKESKEF